MYRLYKKKEKIIHRNIIPRFLAELNRIDELYFRNDFRHASFISIATKNDISDIIIINYYCCCCCYYYYYKFTMSL